jgi:hypothetical protein
MRDRETVARRIGREQLLAFRLRRHHLAARLPADGLLRAAGACGIRNAPPWAAPLSFAARVADLTPDDLDRAVETEKSLIQVWSLRCTPAYVPTRDLAVFTTALLPTDEEATRLLLPRVTPLLDRLGLSATEARRRTTAAARDVLDGRILTKSELQDEIEARVGLDIWPWCDGCRLPHIHDSQLCLVAAEQVCCFGRRNGNRPQFLRVDQWLGAAPPAVPADTARAELVRRYLRCYGPSTAADFAEWAGVTLPDARHSWRLVAPELADVAVEGVGSTRSGKGGGGRQRGHGAVLRDDLPHLEAPADAAGAADSGEARLLPPGDPYLLLRDRETLVPDKAHRAAVWRATGSPGVVLVGAQAVATWRMQSRGKRLAVAVAPFGALSADARVQIETEADVLARFRGCDAAEVRLAPAA